MRDLENEKMTSIAWRSMDGGQQQKKNKCCSGSTTSRATSCATSCAASSYARCANRDSRDYSRCRGCACGFTTRQDDAFNKFYESVVKNAQALQIGEPMLPRYRRAPLRYDERITSAFQYCSPCRGMTQTPSCLKLGTQPATLQL